MLIIAIPKSASTSLVHTLGEIYELKSAQDVVSIKDNQIPRAFSLLGNYHSDCRKLTPQLVEKWSSAKQFYKQHIPPTKSNLRLLGCSKKVILLREPREIISAYRRADKKGLHETRKEFKGSKTEEEWLHRAEEIGLYDELSLFYNGWKNAPTDKLLIHFENLISNEKAIIEAVSEYFNLSINDSNLKNIKLRKHRYSRYNSIQKYANKVLRRLKKIFAVQ